MRKVKGLTLHVYRWGLGDCSLDGISSRYNTLILIGDEIEGPVSVDLDNPPENVVKIVRRTICGREYMHLEPLDGCGNGGSRWYMSGGNIADTSDSRFPSEYPLKIHDRHEN